MWSSCRPHDAAPAAPRRAASAAFRLFGATLLLLTACAGSPERPDGLAGDASEGWIAPEGAGFAVRFPAPPVHDVDTVQLAGGELSLRTWVYEAPDGATAYYVSYADYGPEQVEGREPKRLVESVARTLAARLEAKVTRLRATRLGTAEGVSLEAESTLRTLKGRIYLSGRRLFQVHVLHPRGLTSAEAERFLRSFRLGALPDTRLEADS